jgi:hypothetical protein
MIVISGLPGIKHKFFAKEINADARYLSCYNNFSLPRVDLGILTEVEYKHDYADLVNYDIIGGTFSQVFLDQLRKDYNVQVLNVLRNPSTSYLTGIDELFDDDELPVGLEYVTPLTTSSVIDAITLSKLDYVTTIKFEDVIKNGSFVFANKQFACPSVHNNYNNLITKYESVVIKRSKITKEMLNEFNTLFSNFNESFVNCHNDIRLPKNIFEDLNYQPLTIEEILNAGV